MKWIRVTTLLAAALLLTGCLDIVQSVSEEEGDLQSRYRIIISKSICPPDPTFEFETAEKKRQEMAEIIELADVYLIELPLIAWLEAPGARIVVR